MIFPDLGISNCDERRRHFRTSNRITMIQDLHMDMLLTLHSERDPHHHQLPLHRCQASDHLKRSVLQHLVPNNCFQRQSQPQFANLLLVALPPPPPSTPTPLLPPLPPPLLVFPLPSELVPPRSPLSRPLCPPQEPTASSLSPELPSRVSSASPLTSCKRFKSSRRSDSHENTNPRYGPRVSQDGGNAVGKWMEWEGGWSSGLIMVFLHCSMEFV